MKLPILLSIFALMSTAGTMSARNDIFHKATERVNMGRNKINPMLVQNKFKNAKTASVASRAASLPQGVVLWEDFEEWDGTDSWVPEGWTFEHKKLQADHPGWKAYPYDPYDPINYPSTSYIFLYFTEPVDEWLISPEFTIENGMIFQADCFNAGSYYYDIDAEMWTSNINSIEKANDFIIHISTDGGTTWTPLYSIPDEMSKLGYTKAYEYWDRHGWETIQLPLDDYVGQTAKIAFQIVGNPESEAAGVDNIVVGYPKVDVSYQKPMSALYYGLTDTDINVPGTFMVVPVYAPVTFTNTSTTPEADYLWSYDHTDGQQTSADSDELTIVYGTNHESEKTSRNNIYETPVLTGSGDMLASATYSLPGFIQAGGRGEYQIHYTDTDDYEWLQLGLTVADPVTEGTRTYAYITVPYFGYNNESDRYWTKRAFEITDQEYEADYRDNADNWSRLTRYANFFYTSDTPIVIEGIRTNGYGRGYGIGGAMTNAKFTAEIYIIGDNFEISETPDYTVDCKGEDFTVIDRGTFNHIITVNFKLDEPIVISSADGEAFIVAITGFHDPDNVEYFSPEMSKYDNPDDLALGWVGKETCWGGYRLPASWSPVCSYTEETELPGEQLISFYIMLDGVYPWLEGESRVEIPTAEPVTLKLDSYYDGSDLTISGVPSWLKAEITGRYDKTTLTLTALDNSDEGAVLTISAPGVSKKVTVGKVAGIDNVISDDLNGGNIEYYNLQGIRINNPQKGQTVIRRQGTKATKFVVK